MFKLETDVHGHCIYVSPLGRTSSSDTLLLFYYSTLLLSGVPYPARPT